VKVPHNFSWIFEGRLAAMAMPGCALELAGEMLPYERRFLAWLNTSGSLASGRGKLARRIGLPASDPQAVDHRIGAVYRKFRDIWGILDSYKEGYGAEGEPVDRFVRSPTRAAEDLAFVKAQGIDTLLTLTERPLDPEVLADLGLDSYHVPIPDRTAPTPEQVDACLAFLDDRVGGGRCVLAHCLGGYGRTGTIVACYLVHCGMSAHEAIDGIREKRPGAIENEIQEAAVFELEERCR
jgi:atypical dual specificity phosphatase